MNILALSPVFTFCCLVAAVCLMGACSAFAKVGFSKGAPALLFGCAKVDTVFAVPFGPVPDVLFALVTAAN